MPLATLTLLAAEDGSDISRFGRARCTLYVALHHSLLNSYIYINIYMCIYIHVSNRHNTQCHRPRTLEWGCFDWPRLLIHFRTKFLSSYPKPKLRNLLIYYTKNYDNRLKHTSFFTPTKPSFIENAAVNKSFECFRSKNLLHVIIQKILSLGIVWYTLKKNILNRLLTSPTIRTFLRLTPLSMPTQFLKKPMGIPERNLKTI